VDRFGDFHFEPFAGGELEDDLGGGHEGVEDLIARGNAHDDDIGSIRSILLRLKESQHFGVDDARIGIVNGTVTTDEELRALAGRELEVEFATELDEGVYMKYN